MRETMLRELPDEALLDAGEGKEEEAFEELAKRFEARLFYFALRSLQDRDMAQDAVQETLLRAWKNKKDFRRGSRLSTWLFAIELNWCRDQLRKRGREKSLEEPAVNWEAEISRFRRREADPAREAEKKELSEMIVEALESLPAQQRELLKLRAEKDLDFEDAAAVLGLSATAARAAASRAYKKLRRWLLKRETP